MSKEEVTEFVTTTDFQQYWLHAKEDIQLSELGCHFGHYKAAAHNWNLSALHASKLTLTVTMGILSAWWGNGLTVLLEQVFGNIFIDKMRAICLLEADYNWLNKYVFLKCMMDRDFEEDIVPVEQFAKQGSQASKGVVTLGLFCDIVQAFHCTAAIENVGFTNCYDAVAHPIASIALQFFKVQKSYGGYDALSAQNDEMVPEVGVWPKPNLLGETLDNPLMGFCQGNGTLPPGFLAWGTPTSSELLATVQAATVDWVGLVHASRGSLKLAKCFWYMLG
jgi:hypothetical protein